MISKIHSLVIGINYNSDESAFEFVSTLREISSPKDVTIILVDNTDREDSSEFFNRVWNVCPEAKCIKAPQNLGYFGGAHFGLTEHLKKSDYPDWIIVSNVDIEFNDSSFFEYLHGMQPDTNDIGVIAPSIWTELYKKDRNPHMLKRLTNSQIQFYKNMYRFYPPTLIYSFVARIKHILQNRILFFGEKLNIGGDTSDNVKIIYAPHGSCIVFSKRYFLKGGTLSYPSFLFQEEIFVAEETRKAGLKVVYDPKLRISHQGHVSTGHILSPKMTRYFYESTNTIAERYYSK